MLQILLAIISINVCNIFLNQLELDSLNYEFKILIIILNFVLLIILTRHQLHNYLLNALIINILIIISIIDIKSLVVFDFFIYIIILMSIYKLVVYPFLIYDSLFGAIIVSIPLLLIAKNGMGIGDVKLMFALGLYFGVKQIVFVFIVAVFTCLAFYLVCFRNKEKIAFIPFLSFGCIISLIFHYSSILG